MDWAGHEPRPPRRQAGNYPPEPWHGQHIRLHWLRCFGAVIYRSPVVQKILWFGSGLVPRMAVLWEKTCTNINVLTELCRRSPIQGSSGWPIFFRMALEMDDTISLPFKVGNM
jgi:hypothetical protein